MKQFLTILSCIPLLIYAQTIHNLDFERREIIDIDNHAFFESISEDNRINSNTQNSDHLYTTLNRYVSLGGLDKIQGLINWRDGSGTYKSFNAIHPNNTIDPISIVNCTQSGDNLLVSGNMYTDYYGVGWIPPFPHKSHGILMVSNNPVTFQHDLIEFKFPSLSASSLTPIISPTSGDNYIFITDAVRDNAGNIYAVGNVCDNVVNVGTSFFIKLDPSYNIVDMRINPRVKATWERVVYDESNESIYMVGKGRKNGSPFHPMIAKYDINAQTFENHIYFYDEVFFDIKKDLNTGELVVGWVEKHYHEIGLLFFDQNLNLNSVRIWDNHSTVQFAVNDGYMSVQSSKPNSLYIGNDKIFIRGAGLRQWTTLNPNPNWYGNFYYSTDRFSVSSISAVYSIGRYLEKSINPLFQTMNGMHPWFPKRWLNNKDVLVSITERGQMNVQNQNNIPTVRHGVDFLSNYNISSAGMASVNLSSSSVSGGVTINPYITLLVRQTASSIYGCQSEVKEDILPISPNSQMEIFDSEYDFDSYTANANDYSVYLNLLLPAISPFQASCSGPSNPNYKLARANRDDLEIYSYQIFNPIGQLVAKGERKASETVEDYLAKIIKENQELYGISLIRLETNQGMIQKKIFFE